MSIKVGDLVKVISGSKKIAGIISKVIAIDVKKQRVVLENGPMSKRHMKPERSKKHPEGGIIEIPSSLHISNVMIMSESDSRPVRTGYEFKDGQKIRVARGRGVSAQPI